MANIEFSSQQLGHDPIKINQSDNYFKNTMAWTAD